MASNTYGMYQADLGPVPLPTATTTGSILLVAGNPNTLGTVGNPGQFAYNTVGNVWYYSANGTTWVAASSSGNVTPQSGHGSPVGSVTPNAVGILYLDLDTNNVWVANGATVNSWTLEVGA